MKVEVDSNLLEKTIAKLRGYACSSSDLEFADVLAKSLVFDEFLPCPCCGSATQFDSDYTSSVIWCTSCGLENREYMRGRGFDEIRDILLQKWNRRRT